MYVEINSGSSPVQQIVTFPKHFLSTPNIIYSILHFKANKELGLYIQTQSISTTDVTIKIETQENNTPFEVKVCVLATDYPNQILINKRLFFLEIYNFFMEPNIIGYCAFICGFGFRTQEITEFQFDSSFSDHMITLKFKDLSLAQQNQIDVNVLVFLEHPTIDFKFYSFQFRKNNGYSLSQGINSQNIQMNTQLQDNDSAFYGLSYWNDNCSQYDFGVDLQNQNLISNSNINLVIKSNLDCMPWISLNVFELQMQICPQGKFLILAANGNDYQCVSQCSSINSQMYNDLSNIFYLEGYQEQISMNRCSLCNVSCYGCTGPSAYECTSCPQNQYYDPTNKSCISFQPPQTFCKQKTIDQNTYYDCQSCFDTCETCEGSSQNECLTCKQNYLYFYKGQCMLTAKDGIYCNNQFLCQDCDVSNCKSCNTTQQTCQQCISGYFLYNNVCYSSIQSQTYCDANNICYPCDLSKCQECLNSADFCTACKNNQFLLQNTCQNCNSSKCLTCQNSEDFCLSCSQNQYLFNNSCYSQIPDAVFCQLQNGLDYYACQSCAANCKSCTGLGFNECQECFPQAYFYQNTCQKCDQSCKYCSGITSNDCSECFDGFYLDLSNGLNTCKTCQIGCRLCSQSFDNCSACQSPYYLKGNSCILDCQSNQYFDLNTRQCEQCDISCLSCTNKSSKSCASCISDAQLNINQQCICSNQAYGFSSDGSQCVSCQISLCQICQFSSVCDSCIENAKLVTDSQGKQTCNCNEGFYYIKSNKKCYKCPQMNCQQCSIDGRTCIKCKEGFLFENGSCKYCNNYKFTDSNNQCILNCSDQCQVCSNSSNCTTYDLSNPDEFPSKLCHFTCKQCSGKTSKECLQCASSTREYNHSTQKCECKLEYLEINEPDCSKIEQVQSMIQNIHQYINIIGFPIISLGLILNLSPAVTYSYILQQLTGDFSYIKYDENQSINSILNFYTKYNINNLFDLNKDNNNKNSSNNKNSFLKSQRFLDENLRVDPKNRNFIGFREYGQTQRILENDQSQTEIVSYHDPILEVKKQERFFYSSIIPLSTITHLIIIVSSIHFYEYSKQKILKLSFIFKWNSLILATQLNSNFMIFSIIKIDLSKQEMIDFICIGYFCLIYITQLIWLFRIARSALHQDRSYSIISFYFEIDTFLGKYYFFTLELKKIIFCATIILTQDILKYAIWGLVGLLIIETVLKKVYNPFKISIDFYSTIFLNITFILIVTIFGVFLNCKDATQQVTIVTFILILLIVFTLVSLTAIIIKIITLIKNYKQNNNKNKPNICTQTDLTEMTKNIQLQLQDTSENVRWQKNPMFRQKESID